MSFKTVSRLKPPPQAIGRELGFLFFGDREETTDSWILTAMVFDGGFLLCFKWHIDRDGNLLSMGDEPVRGGAFRYAATPLLRWPECEIIPNAIPDIEVFTVPFLAISFCHCANVPLVREPIPPKLKAKRDRVHGWSPDAWHTLHINPMRKQLDAAGAAEPGGLPRALHVMRGHFKDYREGRGLFGKVHGMWWWESQLTDTSHLHRYEIDKPHQVQKANRNQ